MPTIEEYTLLAKGSKFKDADVWGENVDRYFNNTDEMTMWIDQPSLVPFLKQITDEEMMIERTQREDGRCFETFRRINVFAGK